MAEDRELLKRLQKGDRDALQQIYEKYKDDLLRIGTCMTANRSDAEDSLHDLFCSLAANSGRLGPNNNLKGYLITAIANRSRDRLRCRQRARQKGKRYVADDELTSASVNPEAAVMELETDAQLYEAIAALPEEQRTVITLRLHGNLTFEEIARQTDASENTVRSRYRYGLEKLRMSLGAGV